MKIGKVELILLFVLATLACCILAVLGQTFLARTNTTKEIAVIEQVQPGPSTNTPQPSGIRVGANDVKFFARSKWAYSWTEQTYGDGWRYIGQSPDGNQKITLLHQDMKEWCKRNNISMKAAVEEFVRMCLDGEIEITVSVRRSDD